ncbi:DHH phosphoesterase [Piromyces finnis]|uniref:DHH phosphoesterase n=1 Tax=Piromyces finnis TaxID=1754191 RepID=A0A1Y1VM05_9FUNG|nr:DHH phosphoesterase [Piromyces finnis]|eukprot:ORX59957.1 DHH phosphoesterase [Piromyces finnis]
MNLYQHLQDCKKYLTNNKENNKTTTLVLGNETADLDSMVSALFYSYLASVTSSNKNRQYIPLINLNREDFKLKTDCIYPIVNYFNSQETDKEVNYKTCSQELVFRDDITPEVLASFNELQIVLVDHNRLCYDFEELLSKKKYVVESIIDHHVDENKYKPTHLKIINMVGSTVSLITQLYQQEEQKNKELFQQNPMDAEMAKLFLAPILIDSVNLNREYHRTTDIDENSAEYLKNIILKKEQTFNTNHYYKHLKENKHKIEDLSIYDLLRKDFKKYFHHPNSDKTSPENYFYGISSVSRWCIKKLIEEKSDAKEEIISSMKKWMQKQNLKFLLIMASHLDGDIFKRELFFLFDENFNASIEAAIIKGIENSDIECTCIQKSEDDHHYYYSQKNLKYSRKVLQPYLQSLL